MNFASIWGQPVKCAFCDQPAQYLCDAPGCDAPMCPQHRNKIGHLCYRGKNKNLSGTIDFCPEHAEGGHVETQAKAVD